MMLDEDSTRGPAADRSRDTEGDLRRQVRTRLAEGRLPFPTGVSRSHRGTGRPCVVCRLAIAPADVEREVEGAGVFIFAHEACYKLWRDESVLARSERLAG